MTANTPPASRPSWLSWGTTSLCLPFAALALSACASGTKPMPAPPRYQENLLARCEIPLCPQLPSDAVDAAVKNHLACMDRALECARRHNSLVDAIRGSGLTR